MTSEHLLVLGIVVIVIAIVQVARNLDGIKRSILRLLKVSPKTMQRPLHESGIQVTESEAQFLTSEEMSKLELVRLQELIEERKQIARNTDISYHLWGMYKSYFRSTGPQSPNRLFQDGDWYDVKILQAGMQDGRNRFEFELKGRKFRFVDDEERQGWRENMKFFSLFLYDNADRCLIEIPMKMRVDSEGKHYSILSDGPKAFLPNGWVSDFINVRLKHQSIINQEIRAQLHEERLREIEELKARFGISD